MLHAKGLAVYGSEASLPSLKPPAPPPPPEFELPLAPPPPPATTKYNLQLI